MVGKIPDSLAAAGSPGGILSSFCAVSPNKIAQLSGLKASLGLILSGCERWQPGYIAAIFTPKALSIPDMRRFGETGETSRTVVIFSF